MRVLLQSVELRLKPFEEASYVHAVSQGMMDLNGKWHQLSAVRIEDLPEHHPRNGLTIVKTRRVLETRERYPRDHREIDEVDPISFDVKGFQRFILLARDLSEAVEFEHIGLHIEVAERKCGVVVEERLSSVDAVELNDLFADHSQTQLADVVRGAQRAKKAGEGERQAVFLAESIQVAYIYVCGDVKERIFEVPEELERIFSLPPFDVDLAIHRLSIERSDRRHRGRETFDQAAAEYA